VNHHPRRKRAITETKSMIANKLNYSTPDRLACLSVCLSVRDIFGTRRPSFTKFLCMLPMAVARSSSGGVMMLRTSGFVDDVMLAHKPRLLDVAAQLKRSAHRAVGLAINCAQ